MALWYPSDEVFCRSRCLMVITHEAFQQTAVMGSQSDFCCCFQYDLDSCVTEILLTDDNTGQKISSKWDAYEFCRTLPPVFPHVLPSVPQLTF